MEYIYIEASEDIRLQLRYQEFLRVNTNDNPCIDPNDQPTYSRSRVRSSYLKSSFIVMFLGESVIEY